MAVASYLVRSIHIAPPGEIFGVANRDYEPCGSTGGCSLSFVGPDGPPICGTWLGKSDYCCWAIAFDPTGQVGGFYAPCDHIEGIKKSSFGREGSAASRYPDSEGGCPEETYYIDFYDSANVCCPDEAQSYLKISLPDQESGGLSREVRCGSFMVTDVESPVQSGESSNRAGSSTTRASSATSPVSTSTRAPELSAPAVTPESDSTSPTGTETESALISDPTRAPVTPESSLSSTSTSASPTTTSDSTSNRPPQLTTSYLVIGFLIASAFMGIQF
ncbi:hypothetical protein ABW19_dt0204672 [Dactylella cylindrospora]|nr:hypothetical protein ABW19_dt0204672 [Dactylella cylindrospora]